jgi:predicted deacylase
MLPSEPKPLRGIPVIEPGYPVRLLDTPRAPEACVALHLVEPGDRLSAGDPVAEVRDAWGRPLGDGLVRADHDGFVVMRAQGIYFYPGDALLAMAVRDDAPIVVPYPESYFTQSS